MALFFNKFKKNPAFDTFLGRFPNFGGKNNFSAKSLSRCHAQLHTDFYHHAKI